MKWPSAKPAAADSSGQTTRSHQAITQLGSKAIWLAITMMSALTVSLMPFQPAASAWFYGLFLVLSL